MSEPKASWSFLPNHRRYIWEPANGGQRLCDRLLLLTFLGEARKVSSCRATPDIAGTTEWRPNQNNLNGNKLSFF